MAQPKRTPRGDRPCSRMLEKLRRLARIDPEAMLVIERLTDELLRIAERERRAEEGGA